MKDIYILGSGGFSREVYFLINQIGGYEVKAFVDIQAGECLFLNGKKIPVISEDELLLMKFSVNPFLAIGIGDPKLINKITEKFNNFLFPNLIHPSVIFNDGKIQIGSGNIITAGVVFTTNIKVENFNIFNLCSTVGHDVLIGSCNVVNPSVNISGGVNIKNNNLLGVSATILQNKSIGSNCIIGASSLVVKDVMDDLVVFGVPAKVFKR
jgi:sugar O-acyltransferase (sialic acid O-acetyltransferase NeuD family)